MNRFEVIEVGTDFRLGVYEVSNALEALDAYSEEEGFAPYSRPDDETPDSIRPFVFPDGSATAPFTNYEIIAREISDPERNPDE